MGLEPTTSAVTGRRSNQLSHRAKPYFDCTFKTIYCQSIFDIFYPMTLCTLSSALGQALDLLVTVSCTRYRASTSALSTLSSSRGLTSFEWDISS